MYLMASLTQWLDQCTDFCPESTQNEYLQYLWQLPLALVELMASTGRRSPWHNSSVYQWSLPSCYCGAVADRNCWCVSSKDSFAQFFSYSMDSANSLCCSRCSFHFPGSLFGSCSTEVVRSRWMNSRCRDHNRIDHAWHYVYPCELLEEYFGNL